MFGLDTWLAGFSDGTTLLVVALVAIVLGLRHASDPDHLAAVTTLDRRHRERAAERPGDSGLAWGLGHATSAVRVRRPDRALEGVPARARSAEPQRRASAS